MGLARVEAMAFTPLAHRLSALVLNCNHIRAAARTAGWLLSGMLLAGLLGTALTQGLIAYTAAIGPARLCVIDIGDAGTGGHRKQHQQGAWNRHGIHDLVAY